MVGSWKINVSTNGMPEKVATACAKLNDLFGVEYAPIAYLGSQVVNGINHAVLLEQTVITGKDTKNVVIAIFNEKSGTIDLTLVSIEPVVVTGGELGGIKVDPSVDIPAEAKAAFDARFEGWVGAKIVPFAYLGSQVTKGVDYIFAATCTPVVQDGEDEFVVIVVNAMTGDLKFIKPFDKDKSDVNTLGYSFTWLKSFGKPLGEWP